MVVDLDLPDGGANGVLERTNGLPTLALIGTAPNANANARALGADEVLSTEGPVEEMVAAVERLIGQARTPSGPRPSCLCPFTQPRRRPFFGTSPARGSPKLA